MNLMWCSRFLCRCQMLMLYLQCWRNILHTSYYHNKYTHMHTPKCTGKTIQKEIAKHSSNSNRGMSGIKFVSMAWVSSYDYFIVSHVSIYYSTLHPASKSHHLGVMQWPRFFSNFFPFSVDIVLHVFFSFFLVACGNWDKTTA